MSNRNTRQNKRGYKDKKKRNTQNIYTKIKSKLEQMEIAYNSNEAKKFNQVNNITKIETTNIHGWR
jgi:hypothetical protein